jgi:P pilus assembly chaperone PapD
LSVQNEGTAHVQIANVALSRPGAVVLPTHQVAAYVLSGSERAWSLKPAHPIASAAAVHLSAETDGGPIETDVPVDKR